MVPKVTRVNRIDIGMRLVEDLRRGTQMRGVPEESLMLTGGCTYSPRCTRVQSRILLSSSVFALSDAGEGLFVAWMIEHYIGSDFRLGRLRHVLGLLVATVVGTAVSGVGGTVGYKLVHSPNEPAWITWQQWVASDSIGIITVAPLIIGLLAALRAPPPRRELIEGAAAFVAVVTVTTLIILLLPKDLWDDRVPILLLFPLLLWPAARCRPVFASAASFAVCLMFVLAIIFDIGYFNGASSSSALVFSRPSQDRWRRAFCFGSCVAVCRAASDRGTPKSADG